MASDPEAFLGSVRAVFDDLFARLGSLLAPPEEPAPEPTASPRVEVSEFRRLEVSLPAGTTVPEATPTEPEVPTPGATDPVSDIRPDGRVATDVADPFVRMRELLSALVGRFESLFTELESALLALPVEESEDVADEPSTESRLAVSAYVSIRIDFSLELSGTQFSTLG